MKFPELAHQVFFLIIGRIAGVLSICFFNTLEEIIAFQNHSLLYTNYLQYYTNSENKMFMESYSPP